ncbi:hypothetical protein JG688_00003103 [Phytophthora aleatoria]|uniref:Uncharacterized protein n=1 Tax=Phytophthora aleatoria TaxID=2496075 RepID=A0A8J5MHL3_9STRA|nr:hypothetical protein JG688_00003103 [Phytophthora aleatoria]
MDKWLHLRIEWGEATKRQCPDADEQTMVLGELAMPEPDGKCVWNVKRLCQYIEVRRWFVETGERAFLTISMLARILA